MKKLLIPLAIATLFAAPLAQAEYGYGYGYGDRYGDRHVGYYERHNNGVDARQARQREAIRRGVESGAISRYEAERLWQEQARIGRIERIAKADGHFTPDERARLSHALDRSARHIQQARNDRDRRY